MGNLHKWRTGRCRITTVVAVLTAFGLGAPAAAQAGVLTWSSGVLTYTGGDEENSVGVAHPGINTSEYPPGPDNPPNPDKLEIRENASGEKIEIHESARTQGQCEASYLGVQCKTPNRVVANLGGGSDALQVGLDEAPVTVEIHAAGAGGDDVFSGSDGRDVYSGGPGNDELKGFGGNDLLNGEDGDDTLEGGEGNDELNGLAGIDHLTGDAGNDTIRGGDGDDDLDYRPLYALDGSDTVAGGPGHDKFGYFGRTTGVSINLDNSANDGQAGEADNILIDVEEVDGSDVADVMIGSAGANGLAGRGGDDQITGGPGNDILYGDSDDDRIDGGDGDDVLDGGCHDDRIIGGRGVDALNSDGTCADPSLRGLNDVLEARDGVKDKLVLCTMSGTPGDTAIVDPVDPALGPGNPGACRDIDAGPAPNGGGGTAPGTKPGTKPGTPGTTTNTTTNTTIPAATLQGTVRAVIGPVRLLTGTGEPGQAVRQSLRLTAGRLTLGSLVARANTRLTAVATTRVRGRRRTLGKASVLVVPGTARTLSVKLSRRAKSALRRLKRASVEVRFTAIDPARDRVAGRTTTTFRLSVKR